MEGNAQHVVKQVSKFDGKNADDFLEWSSNRLSRMVFQAPRQPVTLQQVNLRNRARVAAAVRFG